MQIGIIIQNYFKIKSNNSNNNNWDVIKISGHPNPKLFHKKSHDMNSTHKGFNPKTNQTY